MEKKIGILTFHNANNYGAALQAYALQKSVSRLFPTYNVEIVDYQTKAIRNQRSFSALKKSQGLFRAFMHYPFIHKRIKNIDSFCSKNMNLSKKIYSQKQLEEIASEYEVLISGSDQVWNRKLTGGEDVYLQDFNHGKAKKISYAASLGLTEIPDEWKSDYKKYLKDFDAISVREKETRDLLINEFDINSEVHVDPTLLLNAKEWKKISNGKRYKEKFVLAYMVPFQKEVLSQARMLAKKNGFKLFVVCRSLKTGGGKYKGCSKVEEILSLFQNAEYVVTNSFHGTAFSVINHRKFIVNFRNPVGYNIRAKQLIISCGMRLKNEKSDVFEYKSCNWDLVENNLATKKGEALSFLKKEISLEFDS